MQDVFGILLIFSGVTTGLLVQDPVVCRFTESNQCIVALGQRLNLQIPQEDGFDVQFTDKTNTTRLILKYRKSQINTPKPNLPTWQFVDDNKTLILTSAERSDSGTYTLKIVDVNGTSKGIYNLQLNIEAQVSSVNVYYRCYSEVMEVNCSADGENLNFTWTSDLNTLPLLENRNKTVILDKTSHGKVTCRVENHVSYDHSTTELHPCSEPTSSPPTASPSPGTNSTVNHTESNSHNKTHTTHNKNSNNSLTLLNILLITLSSIFMVLVMAAIFTFFIYKKKQRQKTNAPSENGRELEYAQITHERVGRMGSGEARPTMFRAQDEGVEYATVAPRANTKKQRKKEDEVQYGEVVFNTHVKNKRKAPEVQEDCLYSQVQHR